MDVNIKLDEVYPGLLQKSSSDLLHDILLSSYIRLKGTKALEMMKILYESGQSLRMNELQKMIDLKQYKFYEELARLEGSSFIQKKKHPDDNRVTNIELTKQGSYIMQYISNTKEELIYE